MRSHIPVAVLFLGLLACRPGGGFAGDGLGPGLLPSQGTGGDSHALPFDSDSEPEAMERENAYMRVRAYKDREATEMADDWDGEMFFYEDPPKLEVVGHRGKGGWRYSEPQGASLKVHSDAAGESGQTLAEWAPKSAIYIVARIVPVDRKEDLELVTDAAIIEMEAEVITTGDSPESDDAGADEDSPRQHEAPVADDGRRTDERAEDPTAPRAGDSDTGSEQGVIGGGGENDADQGTLAGERAGDPTGVTDNGDPDGHRHGLSRRDGGVKADGSITGIRNGAAQGGVGGSGDQSTDGVTSGGRIEIFGLVIGGIVNVPPSLKPAVDVVSILGQNLSAGDLFKKFSRLAGKKTTSALRTELATVMRTDIDEQLKTSIAKINADKTLSRVEKEALIRRIRHLTGGAYFDMVEREARAEVKRLTDELKKLKGKTDPVSEHHRQLFTEQLKAAENLEKAAKVKPINAALPRRHGYAGGKMPLPEKLHAKYGTHLPFTEDGFPDFSKFVSKEAKIKIQGNRRLDEAAANAAAGLDETPSKWVWHHHQDGTTMQLVPSALHRKVGHNGSYSIYRAERGIK